MAVDEGRGRDGVRREILKRIGCLEGTVQWLSSEKRIGLRKRGRLSPCQVQPPSP